MDTLFRPETLTGALAGEQTEPVLVRHTEVGVHPVTVPGGGPRGKRRRSPELRRLRPLADAVRNLLGASLRVVEDLTPPVGQDCPSFGCEVVALPGVQLECVPVLEIGVCPAPGRARRLPGSLRRGWVVSAGASRSPDLPSL